MEIHLLLLSMAITLVAAALTVPAGFGLATMLTPVVLFWLPPHEAIAVVAIYSWCAQCMETEITKVKR